MLAFSIILQLTKLALISLPLSPDKRMTLPNEPEVVLLGLEDVPRLLALSRQVGWSHTERDWKAMVSTGTTFGHCHSKDDGCGGDDSLASCIHMTEFGTQFATLGMLIVSKPHQKKGLATSLVNRLLAHNKPEKRSIGLITATPAQSFYPQFGFQTTGEHILKLTKAMGSPKNVAFGVDSTNLKMTPVSSQNDIKEVMQFDKNVAKLERSPLLEHLLKNTDRSFLAHNYTEKDASSLLGFGMAKLQGSLLNVGPIVSTDPTAALALCQSLTEDHEGPIRMDVYESQHDFVQGALELLGFHEDDRQAVMMNTFGENDRHLPGNRIAMFCPASQAWL